MSHLISLSDLNDLVRDLNLSKYQSELLPSILKELNLLEKETKVCSFCKRQQDSQDLFFQDVDVIFCNDVDSLFKALGLQYNPQEWRLFIDSSKVSLKAVLLHNDNKHPSIPVGYVVRMKETYENLKRMLSSIEYSKHSWHICGDLKVIAVLAGLQAGYTKFYCFLCQWDSRDRKKHYIKKVWPK
ncbi:hypothetical protein AVEN_77336-1 [Araneus ventricosus]|uniref:Uncharacterized protein n=1 Tax=Araneus ventricosus TaxID=182803 RepID=A0A4Y2C8N6_ARAVE|nr:hypothetical protein AVEN_77336-1 [Araneus ventricosus]